jgi:serine/threonine protein kinase
MFKLGMGETPPAPENLGDEGKDFLVHCLEQEPDKRWTASQLRDHPFAKVSFYLYFEIVSYLEPEVFLH